VLSASWTECSSICLYPVSLQQQRPGSWRLCLGEEDHCVPGHWRLTVGKELLKLFPANGDGPRNGLFHWRQTPSRWRRREQRRTTLDELGLMCAFLTSSLNVRSPLGWRLLPWGGCAGCCDGCQGRGVGHLCDSWRSYVGMGGPPLVPDVRQDKTGSLIGE